VFSTLYINEPLMQVEIWSANLPNVFNLSESLIPRGIWQARNKYAIRFLEIIMRLQTFTEARHEFEEEFTKREEETAAVIQAVINSYKDHNINTDVDKAATSMTAEETNLIERVLSFFSFQLSD
jgi:hypothetical protein